MVAVTELGASLVSHVPCRFASSALQRLQQTFPIKSVLFSPDPTPILHYKIYQASKLWWKSNTLVTGQHYITGTCETRPVPRAAFTKWCYSNDDDDNNNMQPSTSHMSLDKRQIASRLVRIKTCLPLVIWAEPVKGYKKARRGNCKWFFISVNVCEVEVQVHACSSNCFTRFSRTFLASTPCRT